MTLSFGVAGLDMGGGISRYQHQQICRLARHQLANLGDCVGKALFQTLPVVDHFRALAGIEERPVVVALFAGKLSHLRDAHHHNGQIRVDGQRLQILVAEGGADVSEPGHPEVRLVYAVAAHGLVVRDPGKRRGQHYAYRSERFPQKRLDDLKDVFLADKRHLEIDLGELRLPVGAQIFITEAADYLEIAIEARNHEDLLE